MARCIWELERIKGVRQGSAGGTGINQFNKEVERNNFHEAYLQKDLAEEIGLDQRQLQNYKKLLNLIPELQDMVLNKLE